MLPFLRHVNDEPRFGNEPTFSMPLATEDLAALDRQRHEDFEVQAREVESIRTAKYLQSVNYQMF